MEQDTTITEETPVKTFTEEEVNKIITDRLSRERKVFEKKQNETVSDYENRIKTANMTAEQKFKFELEQKEKALNEREAEIKTLTVNGTKKSILAKYKLDEKHLKYIQGNDETEIEASTVEYLATIGEHWKSQAGATPTAMNGGSSLAKVTREEFNKMNYVQKAELFKNNKELYEALTR